MFFLNDSDIDHLLKKMDALINTEGRLVSAQTFELASHAAAHSGQNLAINKRMDNKMDLLVVDRTKRNRERQGKSFCKPFLLTTTKSTGERRSGYLLRTTHHNYRNLAIQGTGQWIFDDPKFAVWQTGPEGTPPILAIEGAEGSGKGFLASAIIRRLRRISASEVSGSRNLVAFYFLDGDPKEELKNADNLGVVPKSLVWQLVQVDTSYLKSVVNTCQKAMDLDPHEILE